MEKVRLSDLGFIKVDKGDKICFYDCGQSAGYYGIIEIDKANGLVKKNIKEEYYNKDELEKAINNENIYCKVDKGD